MFGRSPCGHPGLLLDRIGYVAQDAPLYSGFSVADMLQSLELAGRPPPLFHLTATETALATWSGPDPLHEALQLAPQMDPMRPGNRPDVLHGPLGIVVAGCSRTASSAAPARSTGRGLSSSFCSLIALRLHEGLGVPVERRSTDSGDPRDLAH